MTIIRDSGETMDRPSNIPVWAWGKALKAANYVPDGSAHKPTLVRHIARELISVHSSAVDSRLDRATLMQAIAADCQAQEAYERSVPTDKLESWLYLSDELISRYGYECKEAMTLRWQIAEIIELRKLGK